MALTARPYIRDRFTWLAYFMLAYYAFLQASLGPLMPFLRAELSLSYTTGGLHFSAFALGMILSGLGGDLLAGRYGRRIVFWGGGMGMAVGAVGLALSRRPEMTIFSSFMMGCLGSLLLVMIQAALSDHHGPRRTIALTESNVAASISATVAPLSIGALQQAGLGWRAALFLAIFALGLIIWRFRGTVMPGIRQPGIENGSSSSALPSAYWAYWAVLFLGVSIEWSLVFWGADYLVGVIGLTKSAAAATMSIFFIAMVTGRFAGSRLTRRLPGDALLFMALSVAFVGFILFWLTRLIPLNMLALFTAGLGIANLYPLTLALATGVASDQADKASARVSMGAGLAIFSAPLTLGWLADQIGIQSAFGIVLFLFVVAALVTVIANRLATTGTSGEGVDFEDI